MLDRPMLDISVDNVDRNVYRMYGEVVPNERSGLWTSMLAIFGGVLLFPLLWLPYSAFPLAFAGFVMLPFLLSGYIWLRNVIAKEQGIGVTEIVVPVLSMPLKLTVN